MDNIADYLGASLRLMRKQRNLSLDEAAGLTGVSKAMLGQIERGESNPTISTMWKIASGLKITFSALMGDVSNSCRAVALEELQPVYEAEAKMVLYNVFPFDPLSGFEYLYIELKPGCDYESPSHENVLEEYVVVTQGVLKMTIDGRIFTLPKGSSIRFKGSERHAYANPTDETTLFQNVLRY